MLSRWWLLFFGFILVVFGIAGLIAASAIPGTQSGLIVTSIIWLVTAVIALWVGFGVRSANIVRGTAGIIGGLYFAWGIVLLFTGPGLATIAAAGMMASVGGLLVLLGALGLASALVPAGYLYEREERPMAT